MASWLNDSLEQLRAGIVVQDGLFEGHHQPPEIPGCANRMERIQPCFQILMKLAISGVDTNFAVICRYGVLEQGAQLFAKLFARPYPRILNFYIFIWFEPREQNQVPSEFGNLDWLTHVKHANLSAFANCSGLQNKLRRLRNRHKEPAHLGMRDGNGPALCNLLLKGWDDAPAGTQYIPKTNNYILRTAVLQGLKENFGEPLGRAHDVGGTDSLV